MDPHDIGAMDCIDAMPKRQEAIPALRRRLGRTGSAAVKVQRCSSGGAGQGCSATIHLGEGIPRVDVTILNACLREPSAR